MLPHAPAHGDGTEHDHHENLRSSEQRHRTRLRRRGFGIELADNGKIGDEHVRVFCARHAQPDAAPDAWAIWRATNGGSFPLQDDTDEAWSTFAGADFDAAELRAAFERARARRDATAEGIKAAETAVNEGSDPSVLASNAADADEALIAAMGRSWVLRAAGAPDESDGSWERFALPWCQAYATAYLVRAVELVK